jgi:hypothetical protein
MKIGRQMVAFGPAYILDESIFYAPLSLHLVNSVSVLLFVVML